jgi:hypothetical protein
MHELDTVRRQCWVSHLRASEAVFARGIAADSPHLPTLHRPHPAAPSPPSVPDDERGKLPLRIMDSTVNFARPPTVGSSGMHTTETLDRLRTPHRMFHAAQVTQKSSRRPMPNIIGLFKRVADASVCLL